MLFIGEPYIAQNGDRSRLVCDIGINRRETRTVWFEVDREYEKYLCTERSDAYVIGLLSWAMRAGHDITCTVPGQRRTVVCFARISYSLTGKICAVVPRR